MILVCFLYGLSCLLSGSCVNFIVLSREKHSNRPLYFDANIYQRSSYLCIKDRGERSARHLTRWILKVLPINCMLTLRKKLS